MDSAEKQAQSTSGCVYRDLGADVSCGRPRFESAQHCYWHHETTDKYDPEVVAREFGAGTTLRSAIETEIKAGLSLKGVYLERAPLGGNWFERGADLSGGSLFGANLKGARLSYGSLRNARLEYANLEEAYLGDVDLSGCSLAGARLFRVKLRDNDLKTTRGLERDSFRNLGRGLIARREILEEYPEQAAPMYRELMIYFSQRGDLDGASWAAYKFRLMRHRILRQRLNVTRVMLESLFAHYFIKRPTNRIQVLTTGWSLWLTNLSEYLKSIIYWLLIGYGEKPVRVAVIAAAVMLCYAAAYYALNAISDPTFADALYFSVVTFTTLGYGDVLPRSSFRLLAVSEALAGVVLSGLFLFALSRRAVGRA